MIKTHSTLLAASCYLEFGINPCQADFRLVHKINCLLKEAPRLGANDNGPDNDSEINQKFIGASRQSCP